MKFILIYAVFFFFASCTGQGKKEVQTKQKPIDNNITKIEYEKAINQYSKPFSVENFENAKKNQIFYGIRTAIGKYYPSGEKRTFKEAIWHKNDSIDIAIWYTQKQNNWVPFSYFAYSKNLDF